MASYGGGGGGGGGYRDQREYRDPHYRDDRGGYAREPESRGRYDAPRAAPPPASAYGHGGHGGSHDASSGPRPGAKAAGVRSADVAHEFERFGQLVRVDIPLRNGRSKGFAFVEFIYKQDCENALTSTKGRLRIDGKPVTIELTQRDFAPAPPTAAAAPIIERAPPRPRSRSPPPPRRERSPPPARDRSPPPRDRSPLRDDRRAPPRGRSPPSPRGRSRSDSRSPDRR